MESRLRALAERKVYLGTSSWKYEGWKGLVYHRPYRTQKEFNEKSLAEYAEHYPTVGVDHTYYAWPTTTAFQRYVDETPPSFRFGLKVTERITAFKFPTLKRYGKGAGSLNPQFLDPEVFKTEFLTPIAPFRERLGPLMLEFSQFHPGTIASGREFVDRLDAFFTGVKSEGPLQLAVELRNHNWLKAPYFELLAGHGVAHVFNSWTRMPLLGEQDRLAGETVFPALVARLLLRPGTRYEEAVEAYSPYDRIQDAQPERRAEAAALVRRALRAGSPAYVFVNNRFEGCAPKTIDGILEILQPELTSPNAG